MDGGVNIDLHIAVEHGVNIATVCRSIIGEVRYHVERLTGVDVKNVDIYVESSKADDTYRGLRKSPIYGSQFRRN